jgi:hypothetical protein
MLISLSSTIRIFAQLQSCLYFWQFNFVARILGKHGTDISSNLIEFGLGFLSMTSKYILYLFPLNSFYYRFLFPSFFTKRLVIFKPNPVQSILLQNILSY